MIPANNTTKGDIRKDNMAKSITPIVTTVLLSLLTISLISGTYVFVNRFSKGIEKSSEEAYYSIPTGCIKIESINNNIIYIENCGNKGVITNNTLFVFINGKNTPYYVKKIIKPSEFGEIVFNYTYPSCSKKEKIIVKSKGGGEDEIYISEPYDFDGDGKKEVCYNHTLVEFKVGMASMNWYVNDENRKYLLLMNNTWYTTYPMIVFPYVYYIYYRNETPYVFPTLDKYSDIDFKIIKCEDTKNTYDCIAQGYGDTHNCDDGVVKEYGELESLAYSLYRDNDYKDCYKNSNPWVIYTKNPTILGSPLFYLRFGGVRVGNGGKYNLCIKYVDKKLGVESAEKCYPFVVSYLKVDMSKDNTLKSFGSDLVYSISNAYIVWDKSLPSHIPHLRCRVYLWDYFHNPKNDNGISTTLRRYSSTPRWTMFGIYTSNKKHSPQRVSITFNLRDVNCRVTKVYDDKCGTFYSIYKNKSRKIYCERYGYYSYQRWKWSNVTNNFFKEYDIFEHTGNYGEIFNVSIYTDPYYNNYRVIRIDLACNTPSYFGNTNYKYHVKVNNTDYFWVNDMNYSSDKQFEEALLPYQSENNIPKENIIGYVCRLPLNFCGRARYFVELYNYPLYYGSAWSGPWGNKNNGEYICVGGSECPHANC